MVDYKKDAPLFDMDDPKIIEQHLANIEWAMADAKLKETLPGLVLYITDQVRHVWDLVPDEDHLICEEFIICHFPADKHHHDHVWFRRRDGEGMVIPREILKAELEALFMRLM